MKIIWTILKIIGTLALLFTVIVAGRTLYASIDKTDTFYLKEAQFIDFEYLEKLNEKLEYKDDYRASGEEMNVYVHRLDKGDGIVYAYRWYSSGNVMTIDDEKFKKLTVWISKQPTNYPAELDFSNSRNIKAAYTYGGSAWPQAACSGYIKSGTLVLNKSGSSVSVNVKGIVTPVGYQSFGDYCKEQEIDIEYSASELDFSELNPWLGLKGDHPYDETYR